MPPQDEVARDFMERRGYKDEPFSVERVEGEHCWYYIYDLPEGEVELEVSWTREDGWSVVTSGFNKDE